MAKRGVEVHPLNAATCRLCGAGIRWHDHNGTKIPLDTHEEMAGPHRFAVTPDGLVSVPENKSVLAYRDHRSSCPYYARGGRGRR